MIQNSTFIFERSEKASTAVLVLKYIRFEKMQMEWSILGGFQEWISHIQWNPCHSNVAQNLTVLAWAWCPPMLLLELKSKFQHRGPRKWNDESCDLTKVVPYPFQYVSIFKPWRNDYSLLWRYISYWFDLPQIPTALEIQWSSVIGWIHDSLKLEEFSIVEVASLLLRGLGALRWHSIFASFDRRWQFLGPTISNRNWNTTCTWHSGIRIDVLRMFSLAADDIEKWLYIWWWGRQLRQKRIKSNQNKL